MQSQEGDNSDIATHDKPLWGPRANFIIMADLSDHGKPGMREQLWARKVGNRTFEICCIPFFTYGMALGDIVATNECYEIVDVVKKSGHRTIRVAIDNEKRFEEIHVQTHEFLETHKLEYEWYHAQYVSIDLSTDKNERQCLEFLDALIDEYDHLYYEVDN